MRQSKLFTKTRKEVPKDEVAKNAQLLIRAGFIHKELAGVYDFLSLGLRTFGKITGIIREEMNAIGGQEVHLSVLQNPKLWLETGRWSDDAVDVWFKTKLKDGSEVGLGPTHEEPLTALLKGHLSSWRDLPLALYQIQTKFRNELRPQSGLLRGREFPMKDMYSFSANAGEHEQFYERVKNAYLKIFARVGLGDRTYVTFASGGMFSKYSHEFQTLSDAGEDTIYVDKEKHVAVNKEVFTDEVLAEMGLQKGDLAEARAVEVGNIFSLGTRFSDALGLVFKNEKGESVSPLMGCYGIGPARVMGTVVEVFGSENAMVWPYELAPFAVHLIELSQGDEQVKAEADRLYETLTASGVDVLYDDRDLRAGEKFADADLIGIPRRAVISAKTMAEQKVETLDREKDTKEMMATDAFVAWAK